MYMSSVHCMYMWCRPRPTCMTCRLGYTYIYVMYMYVHERAWTRAQFPDRPSTHPFLFTLLWSFPPPFLCFLRGVSWLNLGGYGVCLQFPCSLHTKFPVERSLKITLVEVSAAYYTSCGWPRPLCPCELDFLRPNSRKFLIFRELVQTYIFTGGVAATTNDTSCRHIGRKNR